MLVDILSSAGKDFFNGKRLRSFFATFMRTTTFKEVSEVIISVAGLEEDENIQQITESIRKHTQKRRAANVR